MLTTFSRTVRQNAKKTHHMKYVLSLTLIFIVIKVVSQTPITNDNFHQAIDTCLSTNPVDGLCYSCEYGAMPDWDVSEVTDMSFAFNERLDFNGDIGQWHVDNVNNMTSMFKMANNFNQDIGDWNVNKVNDMSYMFSSAFSFNKDIGNWDVSNVTDMTGMFDWAHTFNQYIGDWNVSNVTIMSNMFYAASSFNQDIGNWNVSNVTNMFGMFWNAYSFNKELNEWDVSSVIYMARMFHDAHSFDQEMYEWDVSKVTHMDEMFYNASSFNRDISSWCVEEVIYYQFFSELCPLLPEYHPHWGEECDTTVTIKELGHKNDIIAYPTPCTNRLYLNIINDVNIDVRIYNTQNQEVFSCSEFNEYIDVAVLKPGLYILEVKSSTKLYTQKILKE